MNASHLDQPSRHGVLVSLAAPTVAALLCLIVALAGLRGSDWPAHLFRIELFDQSGLTLWNAQWYGGHYALGYSVLFPAVASWFDPMVVGLVSSLVATTCVMLLLKRQYGNVGALAACWVGVGTAINLSVGRLPFALGMAFGLAALVAFVSRHNTLAIALALLTPLASPVAGVFLTFALAGLAIDMWIRQRNGETVRLGSVLTMCVASVLPVAVTALLFPDAGVFPFRVGGFVGVLASLVGLVVVMPRTERVPRIAAAVAAIASVPLFLVANPLGGNMTRLAVLFVTPVIGAALWRTRRSLVLVCAVPLGVWMVLPGVSSAGTAGDPASDPSYHEPLLDFVTSAAGPPGRVEIPFTDDHWEVAYIAPMVPIARGWERQIDIARNAVLYEPTLTAAQYRDWIDDNAVRWVAVPDVVLDEGGIAEASLIEAGLPWLRLVETTTHWQIWEVDDAVPIVEPPGRLVSELADELVIAVDRPGTVRVRAPFMPYWTTDGADACVESTADGNLEIVVAEPGIVTLQAAFALEPALTATAVDACPDAGG